MNQSESLHNLYADFGMTAEKSQVLELEAGNVILSFLAITVDPEKITDEDKIGYKKLVDEIDRKTLGNLLQKIKKIVDFDSNSEKIISDALKKRNYLVHEFFKSHNYAIHSESGRNEMRKELSDISTLLDLAHQHLELICTLLEKVSGKNFVSEVNHNELIKFGKAIKI
ncbi:hypothetical protein [Shewanella sp. UCD-KL21]|uniref:hypothetical protein n=1 Tax=Shewanella sp. UCD-KL21 TaxID=1917164 RepID=UPI0009711C07|nr:hypothetical protein [Shewanella sp. UCD-KL21]